MRRRSVWPSVPPERRGDGLAAGASSEESDETGWLTTFSDLVLQLFGFVVLAAHLGAAGVAGGPAKEPAPRTTIREAGTPSLEALAETLSGAEGVAVEPIGTGVVIRLAEAVAFSPGSARLAPEAAAVLDEVRRIALVLPELAIEVTGHTDDRPIRSALYPSNLDLSLARAAAVARALVEEPALRGRVSARGMGEFQPIASNADAEGRARNRRVELRLLERGRHP